MTNLNTEIQTNRYWADAHPIITVVTPVYNRRKELPRAIASVKNQTFRNFEYIIVNDGSKESMDDIVSEFMEAADFPVMYIKKPNGGVHTARNIAYKNARGEWALCLDSDDELTPNALDRFLSAFNGIPNEKKDDIREVVSRCIDENGAYVSEPFPDGINNLPRDQAEKLIEKVRGEFFGMMRRKILQENPWPEPPGVTFITESTVWLALNHRYSSRAYYINDALRIYHTETENSLSSVPKVRNIQNCRNAYFESAYFLNHFEEYPFGFRQRVLYQVRYGIMKHILNKKDPSFPKTPLVSTLDKIMSGILYLPTAMGAMIYIRKKM